MMRMRILCTSLLLFSQHGFVIFAELVSILQLAAQKEKSVNNMRCRKNVMFK